MSSSLTKHFLFNLLSAKAVQSLQEVFSTALHPAAVDFRHAMVQEAELPFFPDFRLYILTDLRLPAGNDRLLLARPGHAVVLNGDSEQVYNVNTLSTPRLGEETVAAYARFFFGVTRTSMGAFTLVEKIEDIPWLPETNEAELAEVAASIAPLKFKERTNDGRLILSCTMLFHDSLYRADIIVATKPADILRHVTGEPLTLAAGMVMMTNEERLAEELNVPVEPITDQPSWVASEANHEMEEEENPETSRPILFAYNSLPRFTGFDFRQLSEEEGKTFCSLLPDPLRWPDFAPDKIAVQAAPIPFYEDFQLIALIDSETPPPNVRFVLYKESTEGAIMPITGTSEPIYAINDLVPIKLTTDNLPLYAKFFFFLVRGVTGIFHIFERPEEITWHTAATEEEKDQVNTHLQPVVYKGVDSEGFHTLTASVIFENSSFEPALFITEIKIAPQAMQITNPELGRPEPYSIGQIKLENEELIFENLNVII